MLHEELDMLAGKSWSVAGEAAIRAAAIVIRSLAKGFEVGFVRGDQE